MRKYEKIYSLSELFDENQVRKNADGNEDQVIFARRLCKCLDEEGINANELGRRTGISKSSISAYINGEQKPNIIQIKKIAEILEVSSDYLLNLSTLKSTNEDFKKVHKLTGLTDEAIMELKKIKLKLFTILLKILCSSVWKVQQRILFWLLEECMI